MMPYKNGTPWQKMAKGHFPRAELSDFLKRILKFAVQFRRKVMGF